MKRFASVLSALCLPVALLVPSAGAVAQAPSGDTCAASGTNPTYTLRLVVPANTEQYGFAFGATGTTITNVSISGVNGNFTTQKLAAGTSAAFISDTPLTGSVVATVTTTGTTTGFAVIPAGMAQTTYFDSVTCALTNTAPAKVISISVNGHPTYYAPSNVWRLVVTVPGAGTVSAIQLLATNSNAGAMPIKAKALVQVKRIGSKSAGKVTLSIHPTAMGLAQLKVKGSIKVKLHVTYDASGGKSGSKIVSLTLKK